MKTFSRFKVHLNNGMSQTCTPPERQTLEDFVKLTWPNSTMCSLDITERVLTPFHAVTMIEGLEDEKQSHDLNAGG